jgi:outer membrane lipopolysaccharide assembly protein LptE/RlpB
MKRAAPLRDTAQTGSLLLAVLIPLLAATALAGCGYRLSGGGSLPDHVRRIAVPMFENRTQDPDIAQRMTESIVDEFVHRGNYVTVPSPQDADAVLRGTILTYRTVPISIDLDGRATRYEIQIHLEGTLEDLVNDEVLWEDDHYIFRGQYDVDPVEARSFDRSILAIEEVSREAARSVVATILEGF